MTILMGKVRNRSPLHQSYVRKLLKPLASQSALSKKLDGSSFTSPNKRYKESRERVDVDAFDTDAIRRTVHEFYEKKEYPTLDKLLQVLKEKMLFKGGWISLWKLLRNIFILEENQMSYQRKKAAIQNQMAASVVMENRYK